jgi:glutaminase
MCPRGGWGGFAHAIRSATCALLALAILPVAQARGPIGARDADYQLAIEQAHKRYQAVDSGKVPDNPPPLAGVSPALFGISIVRVDGRVFEAGDASTPLILESMSAPFAAALLADQQGAEVLSSTMGAVAGTAPLPDARGASDWGSAPSSALESAGSMSLLGLIHPKGDTEKKWHALGENLGRFAGRAVNYDPATHQSSLAAAERLKTKALQLSREGRLADDPQSTADLYVRQQLVRVSTRELAVMAATLANDGRNPVTRDRAVKPEAAKSIQSLLMNSGLRGQQKAWLVKAGVGAMTSRSGAIILVVPGRLGIAVYSPPLDSKGVSVRGERAIRYLIKALMIGPDPSQP